MSNLTDLANCGDCGVKPGEPHAENCDVARCMQTGHQRLSCFGDHDHGRDVWTGVWPGEIECIEFGWFSVFTPDGWRRCGPDEPGAGPDLNRLHEFGGEARWDRAAGRWVKV